MSILNSKPLPLFYHKLKKYEYLYDENNTVNIDELDKYKELSLPLIIDTEFWQENDSRQGVTLQVKGINNDALIFAHEDLESYADKHNKTVRHPVARSEFIVVDYLNKLGLKTSIRSRELKELRDFRPMNPKVINIDLYSHFGLAELMMIVNGECKKDIDYILKNNKKDSRKIVHEKRLRTYTENKGKQCSDYVELPWFMSINNIQYRVKLRIIDTSFLHGIISYEKLASSLEIKLEDKNIITNEEKSRMNEIYFEKPTEFDRYALGDLLVYEFLKKNAQLFYKIYQDLDIVDYYKYPKLSIGRTVSDLFEAVLMKHCGIKWSKQNRDEFIKKYCNNASPMYLKNQINNTSCLLSKVFGGRAKNNNPLMINMIDKTIVDMDIAGAYATILSFLYYPIGKPIIEGYDHEDNNNYKTLRQWLEQRKYWTNNSELIDGLWSITVSNKGNSLLKHPQDLLLSWFDFKLNEVKKMNVDNDELDVKTGKVKVFSHEVKNACISSNLLEWILKICNPVQKNELLDNLVVKASIFYPKYSKVESFDELVKMNEKFNETNNLETIENKETKTGKTIKTNNINSYWYGIDLGEVLIKKLIAYRKFYKLRDGDHCALQNLFKLICNTVYGLMASPFFDVSNVVCGNNITSTVRMMVWYCEKSLNGILTITDGTQFDINKVVYALPERRITASSVFNFYREKSERDIRINRQLILKPLGNYYKIEHFYDGEYYCRDDDRYKKKIKLKLYKTETDYEIIEDSKKWIDEMILKHLKLSFPDISIFNNLHHDFTLDNEKSLLENKPVIRLVDRDSLFLIAIKDIYDQGVFHGTANYLLINKNEQVLKMRSYEKKTDHHAFEVEKLGEETIIKPIDYYDKNNVPSKVFLSQLRDNPSNVKRAKAFKKSSILKTKDYGNNHKKWIKEGLECGDSYQKTGLLRELSISQFTLPTIAHYKSLERELNRNKRRHEQTYEGYFINNDNSLNYTLMIETIDNLINDGYKAFNPYFDKHNNKHRKNLDHPEKEIYSILKGIHKPIRKDMCLSDKINFDSYDSDYESILDDEIFDFN